MCTLMLRVNPESDVDAIIKGIVGAVGVHNVQRFITSDGSIFAFVSFTGKKASQFYADRLSSLYPELTIEHQGSLTVLKISGQIVPTP